MTKDFLMTLQTMPTRPLLAALLLSLASTCVQAEWVRISTSDDAKVSTYADPDTVRTLGTRVQLMTLTDYQDAQLIAGEKKFQSVKMLDEFNCDDGSGRHMNLSAMSDNMGKGSTVAAEMKPAPPRPIRDATADAEMLRFACTRK